VLTSISTKEARVREDYDGRQFVGVDLHRRRSVLVRMTEDGERLETVRIVNDRDRLAAVMARAGEAPEVVLEATYGWYWAVDALAAAGACVHLAHPLGVKVFSYRRVKNDERDAADLADLLRMRRLPEAWIAPPEIRELRDLVRHRARLVHLRSSLRCQIHAVLANQGVTVPMSDLFGVKGNQLLDRVVMSPAARARVASARRVLDALDFEVDFFTKMTSGHLAKHPGFRAVQTLPGIGPVLGAVMVAEIGDVTRFRGPTQLASWAGLTPSITSPIPPCTVAGSPSRAADWCAGRRWKRCNSPASTPVSAATESALPTAAAATSAPSPPPVS
jgi:transposase